MMKKFFAFVLVLCLASACFAEEVVKIGVYEPA